LRKLLYLLKDPSPSAGDLLPCHATDQDVSVILIQEGVVHNRLPVDRVYVLLEDTISRGIAPAFPTISYQDMLRMMFEADTVVAL
jgi:hypothetical protein